MARGREEGRRGEGRTCIKNPHVVVHSLLGDVHAPKHNNFGPYYDSRVSTHFWGGAVTTTIDFFPTGPSTVETVHVIEVPPGSISPPKHVEFVVHLPSFNSQFQSSKLRPMKTQHVAAVRTKLREHPPRFNG